MNYLKSVRHIHFKTCILQNVYIQRSCMSNVARLLKIQKQRKLAHVENTSSDVQKDTGKVPGPKLDSLKMAGPLDPLMTQTIAKGEHPLGESGAKLVDSNLVSREALINEAFQEGYFEGAKEIARKGTKLWIAPKLLRPRINCTPVPRISGNLFSGGSCNIDEMARKHKVSLIAFAFNSFGEKHVKSYVEPFYNEFKDLNDAGLNIVLVEEKWIKVPFVWLFKPYNKFMYPKHMHGHILSYYRPMVDSRRRAGMTNSMLGWVNLVDSEGYIRWQAHGPPTPDELDAMIRLSKKLLSA